MSVFVPGNSITADPDCNDCCGGECPQLCCLCCASPYTRPNLYLFTANLPTTWDNGFATNTYDGSEVSLASGAGGEEGNCFTFGITQGTSVILPINTFQIELDICNLTVAILPGDLGAPAAIYLALASFDCCSTDQTIAVTAVPGTTTNYTSWPTTVRFKSCGCVGACCNSADWPDTLYCTLAAAGCAPADGKVITLTKDSSDPLHPFWYGEEPIACTDCDRVYARVDCVAGAVGADVGYKSSDEDAHPCGFDFSGGGCDSFVTVHTNSPVNITGRTCYGGIGSLPCCADGTLDWTITE